ncbi:hypothetical protein [Phormidesmis sp. 146-33]
MNATHLISNIDRSTTMYSSTPQDDSLNPAMFALREALPAELHQSTSHSLFAQLRSRYPTGALSSELVQVHEGQFVVRALVQVGGLTMATGMAAADRVELAEDRARIRAMEVLGIAPTNLASPSVSAFEMSARLMTEASQPEIAGSLATPQLSESQSSTEPTLRDADSFASPVDPIPTPEEIASPPRSRTKKKEAPSVAQSDDFLSTFPGLDTPEPAIEMEYEYTEAFEPAVESAKVTVPDMQHDPVDLSDAIAQIGTEIERIGWTKKQGSTYLQQTYGKKTRAELTEDELLEFLHYLKALPSKGHPSMSQIPF